MGNVYATLSTYYSHTALSRVPRFIGTSYGIAKIQVKSGIAGLPCCEENRVPHDFIRDRNGNSALLSPCISSCECIIEAMAM